MARALREVVYVDGASTAFGRAGAKGIFWGTRADDMAVNVVRKLLRRNPELPPDRVGDVIFAATAQVGDQGRPLGRDVGLVAGIPKSVPDERLSATGVRLIAQLAYGFRERPQARYGLTGLCIGRGMGAAALWENSSA